MTFEILHALYALEASLPPSLQPPVPPPRSLFGLAGSGPQTNDNHKKYDMRAVFVTCILIGTQSHFISTLVSYFY